uniref:Uncharacterized protein n=1 Tax=Tetradesmus obliquus TaxID=3088 RepID=A0A383W6G5_TETOB|eukprot:jgi/Sobl393_1/17461/SZX72732.1
MQAALQRQHTAAVQAACQLPAAQQLAPAEVAGMLQAASFLPEEPCLAELCRLRPARQLAAADWAAFSSGSIITTALQCQQDMAQVAALLRLPAAKQLAAAVLLQLLETCLQLHGTQRCYRPLAQLLAAADSQAGTVDSCQLQRLLGLAKLSACLPKALHALLQLPAAVQLPSSSVEGLLQEAVAQPDHAAFIKALCRLPAARATSAEAAGRLLLAAVRAPGLSGSSSGMRRILASLGSLPVVQSGAAVPTCEAQQRLLQAVLQPGSQGNASDVVVVMCKTLPMQQLTPDALAQLLPAAVPLHLTWQALVALLHLPCAEHLSSDAVQQLLLAAADAQHAAMLVALTCLLTSLPAAQQVCDVAAAERLLLACFDMAPHAIRSSGLLDDPDEAADTDIDDSSDSEEEDELGDESSGNEQQQGQGDEQQGQGLQQLAGQLGGPSQPLAQQQQQQQQQQHELPAAAVDTSGNGSDSGDGGAGVEQDASEELLAAAASNGNSNSDSSTASSSSSSSSSGPGLLVPVMLRLPVMQQLSSAFVAKVLHAAIACYTPGSVISRICGLPAAAQLRSAVVGELLTAAVHCRGRLSLVHLCKLPGAQAVEAGLLQQLLHKSLLSVAQADPGDADDDAHGAAGSQALEALLGLPAAQQLTAQAAQQLLQMAVQLRVGGSVARRLCALAHRRLGHH